MLTDVERKERLGYAIREAMRRRRLTPPKLGKQVGRSGETIRRWMAGTNAPSVLELGALAEALGVDPLYLVNPPPVPEYPLDDYLLEDEPTVADADRVLDEELAGPAASTLQQPTRDRPSTAGGSGGARLARDG